MKKNLSVFVVLLLLTAAASAQDLITKVPSASAMVIKYSGENFTKRMSLQKLDSYNFVKKDLLKALGMEDVRSVQNTGINFTEDAYQYVDVDDSTINFVTLLHIKDISKFVAVLRPEFKKNNLANTEKKNGYEFLAVSDHCFIGWNNDVAVVVMSSYTNRQSWYMRYYSDTSTVVMTDTTLVSTDSTEMIQEITVDTVQAPIINEAPVKKKITDKTDGKKTKKKTKKGKNKKEDEEPITEYKVETTDGDSVITTLGRNRYLYNDSIDNLKRELWDQQQDMIAKKIQHETAETIFGKTFSGNIVSIRDELSYKKTIDPQAHVAVWLNNENLISRYQRSMYGNVYRSILGNRNRFTADTTASLRTGMNVYFEKDKIRISQKSFSPDSSMQSLSREVMNSRQNTRLTDFINPGNLGFVSVSVNTEATAKYYYTVLKQYLRNMPNMRGYGDLTDTYVDFLEIAIDEKSLSDLSPGNYLFVLHDMKTKKVDYTDFVYDKEFNSKEVTKTTKELAPDFTFIMQTKNEGFMERLAKLPLKHAEKEKFDYKDMGGYYRLAFDSTKNALSELYFMVKDGMVIVTTSKEVINLGLSHGAFKTDEQTKRSVLDHNYAADINTKKIFDIVSSQAPSGSYKKMLSFLSNNFGDIKSESSYQDNMVQATSTINFTGNHANGLEFIFNMIQGLTDIYRADVKEKAKHSE